MVFFNCNACGESLKKNQVEKHYLTKCRRCEVLSCVDCGKEFWGDSYQTHTKCISEEEKYSGKNYVAKVNKGEVKQEQWIQKVQAAIQKAPPNPQLKAVLKRLEEFPNVPRKKAKFENFLKCSLRVFNTVLHNAIWDLLMAEAVQNGNSTAAKPADSSSNPASVKPAENSSSQDNKEEGESEDDTEEQKKLSKRERKEERRKQMHKAEKKDRQTEVATDEGEGKKKKKKGKRKKEEEEEEEEDGENEAVSQPKKKKKMENGDAHDSSSQSHNGSIPQPEENGERSKFNWAATITAVLEAKGEISVKKLRKKVLAEYASSGGSKPEEKLLAKFNKKLNSLPQVRVLKDRVSVVQS